MARSPDTGRNGESAALAFFLPSYSPEINSGERLNTDLKQAIGSKMLARTKAKLHAAADEHMQFIPTNPDRVSAHFRDPMVSCAARRLHRA